MRWLLLLPITVGMLGSIFCWMAGGMFDWPSRWTNAWFLAGGVTLQVTSLWMAGYLDG